MAKIERPEWLEWPVSEWVPRYQRTLVVQAVKEYVIARYEGYGDECPYDPEDLLKRVRNRYKLSVKITVAVLDDILHHSDDIQFGTRGDRVTIRARRGQGWIA